MPNLHNQYTSAKRIISQKNPEYMLTNHCHIVAGKI